MRLAKLRSGLPQQDR